MPTPLSLGCLTRCGHEMDTRTGATAATSIPVISPCARQVHPHSPWAVAGRWGDVGEAVRDPPALPP